MKNIAIVTGASSGLGKEFVKLLITDQNINEIFVLARSQDKLNELKNEYGDKIRPYPTDLSDINNIKAFGRYLEKEDVNIKLLINNAGFAKFCSYDDISIDESLNMINLNVSGVVAMGLVCIPFMNKNSHIINIASQASFQPLPYQNIYSSTKSFVKNYSRALNVELLLKSSFGIVKVGLFAAKGTTNFVRMVTPDVVAKKALKDAYNNKDISVYGLYVNFCMFLSKILPEKLIMKIWLLQQGLK